MTEMLLLGLVVITGTVLRFWNAGSMPLTHDELRILGAKIAEKLNRSTGTVKVLIPMQGFSSWDKAGEKYHDLEKNGIFR